MKTRRRMDMFDQIQDALTSAYIETLADDETEAGRLTLEASCLVSRVSRLVRARDRAEGVPRRSVRDDLRRRLSDDVQALAARWAGDLPVAGPILLSVAYAAETDRLDELAAGLDEAMLMLRVDRLRRLTVGPKSHRSVNPDPTGDFDHADAK